MTNVVPLNNEPRYTKLYMTWFDHDNNQVAYTNVDSSAVGKTFTPASTTIL